MRRVLLAGVFILPFIAGAAFAADLPSAAPAPAPAPYVPPPVFTWSGFYVGGYVGGEWNSTKFPRVDGAPVNPSTISPSGVVGGGIVGGNVQYNSFVFGLEGDLGASGVNGTNTGFDNGFAVTSKATESYVGRIRGRAGVAFGDALVFLAGGVSFDSERIFVNAPTFGPAAAARNSRTGWNIGGGLDYAFTNNWFGRVEYIFDDYGNTTYALNNGYAARRVSSTASTVRVAVGYKF